MVGFGGIQLSFNAHPAFFAAALLILAALTYYMYRTTIPPVSQTLRSLLMIFRFLTLLIVLVLLFSPIVSLTIHRQQKPSIAVLIDVSSSMSIQDEGGRRSDWVRHVLKDPIFRKLARRHHLRYFCFSSDIREFDSDFHPDSLRFNEDGTDITQALFSAKTQLLEHNFSGVILLSDGIANVGFDPRTAIRRFGAPIFAVAIGDPREKKDILIEQVSTNEVVYSGTRVPVDILVRSSGFQDLKVPVELWDSTGVIDSQLLQLAGQQQLQKVRLHFIPKGEGLAGQGFQKYRVRIPPLKGEFTKLNNERSFYVKVLKSRVRILLLAGEPSADFKFVKRALEADSNFQVIPLIQRKPSGFYPSPYLARWKKSDDYDLVIFLNFPKGPLQASDQRFLRDLLINQRKPLFYIQGRGVSPQRLRPFQEVLPFRPDSRPGNIRLVYPELTAAGQEHPVMRVQEDPLESESRWQELPPVYTYLRNFPPRPGSEVLARIDKARSGLPQIPRFAGALILAQKLAERKSLAVLAFDIWRWDLMMWGVGKTNETFETFLNHAVRWLITREEIKPVRITTDKLIYRSGEDIHFVAQVYTEDLRPLDGAEVRVRIIGPGPTTQSFEETLEGIGNGKYEATVRILQGGDYQFEGKAFKGSRILGRDKGRFSVGEFQIEFLRTRMNEPLLRKLAEESGGHYLTPDRLEDLEKLIQFAPKTWVETREINLWNKAILLLLFIGLLATEWTIRRRKGML